MILQIDGFKVHVFGQGEGGPCIFVGVSDREDGTVRLARCVASKAENAAYTLVVFMVTDWNAQLSPWPARATFGDGNFSGDGSDTFVWLTKRCVPELKAKGLMRYFADELGYGDERDFWGIVGMLHDLDFEKYPDEHCIKSQEIMRERGVDERIIHATASHGYMLTVDISPEHEMEKVLYAVDELKWPDRGSGAYAAVEERAGSGTEVCEEEI